MSDISSFDYIILLVLLLFLLRGLCVGFVRQLAVSFALVGSYWLAGHYVGEVIPYAKQVIVQPKVIFWGSFIVLFAVFALLFILLDRLLHKIMDNDSRIGWLNRIVGGSLGLARGILIAVLIYMILSPILPPSHHFFRNSLALPYMEQAGQQLRQFIEDAKVREDIKPLKDELKKEKKKEEPAKPASPPISDESAESVEQEPVQQQAQEEEATDDPAGSIDML